MIDVDDDDIDQREHYEAVGNLITMDNDNDTVKNKTPFSTNTSCENPYLYAENVVNPNTNEVEPKIFNNMLVNATNSKYYATDNKKAATMSKTAASMFPWIGSSPLYMHHEYLL